MIKIELDELIIDEIKYKHLIYCYLNFEAHIAEIKNIKLTEFLKNNFEKIVIGDVEQHIYVLNEAKLKGIDLNVKKNHKGKRVKAISLIFDYDKFSKNGLLISHTNESKKLIEIVKLIKDIKLQKQAKNFLSNHCGKVSWNAYELLRLLNIKTCPYCNRNYTSLYYDDTKGKTRPEIDHFLSQKDYLIFSISLFNMIPSCHVCNSNLKGDSQVIDGSYRMISLSPYKEGFGDYYPFRIDLSNTVDYNFLFNINVEDKNYNIILKPQYLMKKTGKKTLMEQHELHQMSEMNNEIFKISKIYNREHKDIVNDLLLKAKIYNKSYIQELLKLYPSFFKSEEDVKKLLLGIDVVGNIDIHHNKVLQKLIFDISKQIGLL